MKKIFKYQIDITDEQKILMPVGANILCAQVQSGAICLWAEVCPTAGTQYRTIIIVGTGHEMPSRSLKYISTVQMPPFVRHVYEGS